MKVYELFLLLLLLCSITIQHKNNGIVRKLQDDDNDSDMSEDTVENESSGEDSESSGSESESSGEDSESSGSESESSGEDSESSGSESESSGEDSESSGSESESSGSDESQDTSAPTSQPTETPTSQPTQAPTSRPTQAPTSQPTDVPTSGNQTDAPTSSNQTIDTDDVYEPYDSDISDPTPAPGLPPSKVICVGFGKYHPPKPYRRGPVTVVIITFVVYFQRIYGYPTLSRHMNVGLNMFYHRRLRALQEQVNANCSRASGDNEDFIKYNCEAPADDKRTLGQIECLNNFQFEGQGAVEMEISSFANSTKDDLMTQTSQILPIVLLNNTRLEVLGLNFTLDGFKNRDFNPEPSKVVMSFDESRGEGELKNATCYVQKKSEQEYKLNCGSEDSISAPLNGANGIASTGQKVMIYMAEGEETTLNTGLNHQSLYERGSSSGLSGGAIAAIVIALVVALIAAAVIVIALMSKKTAAAAAPFQESTLGINTNSISQ